jgi:predicted permease
MLPSILSTVAPLFGIIGLGYLARRLGVVGEGGVKGLVFFAFNFAIPSLLFRSMATMELPEVIEWGFLAAFYVGAVTMYFLGMAGARFLFHRPTDHQAIFGMGSAFSNSVLLGIPIVITAYGPEATLPLFLIIAFHSATFMPLTAGIIQSSRGTRPSAGQHLRTLTVELLTNPIVAGLLLGLVANLLGAPIPGPLDGTLELLGGAAVPCALFALGGSLGGTPLVGDVGPAVFLTSLKLVGHPLLVWIVAVPVLGLDGLWAPVAVTIAAMPAGVNVYLFGARYDAAAPVAARTVLLSTVLSMVTIPVILALLGGGGAALP